MLGIVDKRGQNIDIGQLNGAVFLDLKKAFDTVDHGMLLHKLYLYGIKRVAFNWFRSYLSRRKQYCQVNDHLSNPLEMICGIPQGSILGRLSVKQGTGNRGTERGTEQGTRKPGT